MASFGLKVIRGAFGIGERLSPSISGWLAFELFCRTPNERRLTVNERKAIAAASPFMREARLHRLQTRTHCVVAHEFRPETAFRGTVLVLHEFEGMEYKAIAKSVGISVGTVMSRLFYARRRLASLLSGLKKEHDQPCA